MTLKLIANLKKLHLKLEHEIAAERARRLPDETRIARLKKTKLKVKDRMHVMGATRPERELQPA